MRKDKKQSLGRLFIAQVALNKERRDGELGVYILIKGTHLMNLAKVLAFQDGPPYLIPHRPIAG